MSFVFLLVSMERALDVYDEGIIVYGAARVQGGAIPYRDFWTVYAPGQYYVLAGLFQIFGSWVLVERLWDLAVRAAISVLVFSQVSTLTSRWYGIGAFVVAVLWLGAYRSYGYPVFPALLFTGGGAYLLAEYLRRTGKRSTLVLSGLGVGLAILFRHDVGFLACLSGALLLSS
jgi:4-amino-4-deoxy-L-arabinose transferase-like glycosyltransferase